MPAETIVWIVSAALLAAGLAALVLRRQLLAMVLGLELMINASNLNFVYFGRALDEPAGWAAALWVLAAAAAEVVVGLSLILAWSRRAAAETDQLRELEG